MYQARSRLAPWIIRLVLYSFPVDCVDLGFDGSASILQPSQGQHPTSFLAVRHISHGALCNCRHSIEPYLGYRKHGVFDLHGQGSSEEWQASYV